MLRLRGLSSTPACFHTNTTTYPAAHSPFGSPFANVGPDSFFYRSIVKTVALAPNEIPLGAVSQNDKGAMPPTLDNALNNAPSRTCSFGSGWVPNYETHITPLVVVV